MGCERSISDRPSGLVERLRAEVFWDVDAHRLDPERHGKFIIERIAERGNLEEMRLVWAYYGPERIRQVLEASRALTNRTVYYFAGLFDVPLDSFRSYRKGLGDAIAV